MAQWSGWIPREPSLGQLTQLVIPKQFRRQDTRVANPPALLLPLIEHIEMIQKIEEVLNSENFDETIIPQNGVFQFARISSWNGLPSLNCEKPTSDLFKSDICHLDPSGVKALVGETRQFIDRHFPHIVEWLKYFQRTQRSLKTVKISGKVLPLYRWAQRSADHTLASGLDDSPRGLLVNQDEAHLDLQSWVAFMARSIAKICR